MSILLDGGSDQGTGRCTEGSTGYNISPVVAAAMMTGPRQERARPSTNGGALPNGRVTRIESERNQERG
jgi:hypothetical protein